MLWIKTLTHIGKIKYRKVVYFEKDSDSKYWQGWAFIGQQFRKMYRLWINFQWPVYFEISTSLRLVRRRNWFKLCCLSEWEKLESESEDITCLLPSCWISEGIDNLYQENDEYVMGRKVWPFLDKGNPDEWSYLAYMDYSRAHVWISYLVCQRPV